MTPPGEELRSALDAWLPEADFSTAHARTILASPAETYAAIGRADFSRPWIVRTLMALRTIPSILTPPSPKPAPSSTPTTASPPTRLLGIPFTLLTDQTPTELVLGIEGQFWRMNGGLERVTPDDFRLPVPPGRARAVWNFRLEPLGTTTRLHTETRIRCGDEAARRRFGRYWILIKPFSGLIRRAILAEIAAAAEYR